MTRRAGAPALHREASAPRAEAASDLQPSPGFGWRRPRVPVSSGPTGSSAAPEVGTTPRPAGREARQRDPSLLRSRRCIAQTGARVGRERGSRPVHLGYSVDNRGETRGPWASRLAPGSSESSGRSGGGPTRRHRDPATPTKSDVTPGETNRAARDPARRDSSRAGERVRKGLEGHGARLRSAGTSWTSRREAISVGLCESACRGQWRTQVDDCGRARGEIAPGCDGRGMPPFGREHGPDRMLHVRASDRASGPPRPAG